MNTIKVYAVCSVQRILEVTHAIYETEEEASYAVANAKFDVPPEKLYVKRFDAVVCEADYCQLLLSPKMKLLKYNVATVAEAVAKKLTDFERKCYDSYTKGSDVHNGNSSGSGKAASAGDVDLFG